MKINFLEQLISEWYEYKGYFVKRNIHVEKRQRGGYECELDVVAFNPKTNHLVHVEPSMDADSWEKREKRYKKKFELGRKYIPQLFQGINLPSDIEQIALLVFASKKMNISLGGGKIMIADELLRTILEDLRTKTLESHAIPEQYPILRTLQFCVQYKHIIKDTLFKT
jgi:hypothetical protein